MAETTGTNWAQVKSGDRHGTQGYGQASDGTGASGNIPKFNADGSLTDSTIPVTGLGAWATIQGVQQESYIYGPDSGTANAYALTQTPTPTIVAGSIAVLKVANTNTGASTLSVNGGTATAVKEKDGVTALAAGDWTAGQIVAVIFDGTNWQWIAGGGNFLKHGTDAWVQMSDDTGANGNLAMYNANGSVTDSGISWTTVSTGGSVGSYNVAVELPGVITQYSTTLGLFVFTETVNFPGNFAGSLGKVGANPTVAQSWTVSKNGAAIGTVSISTAGAVTFATTGGATVPFLAGDELSLTGSNTDTTLTDVSLTFLGIRATATAAPIAVVTAYYIGGPIPNSQIVGMYTFTATVTFGANFGGAEGKCGSTPAATAAFSVKKNGTAVGSVSIDTSGAFAFSTTGGTSVVFNAGDEMLVTAPASHDSSLADLSMSFTASVTTTGGGGGGSGSVTSVALTVPSRQSVSGSPITTAGTLAITDNTQSANLVFAGPASGGADVPTFRTLVSADVPSALTNPMTTLGDLILGGSAGAPQRIAVGTDGYVLTARSSATYGVDWEVSTVPTAISLGPDWPPASPGSFDDEFTGTSLGAAWTWVNQGSATATESKSFIALVGPGSASSNWHYIYQSAPGSTPWEVQAKCTFLASVAQNFWSSGIVLSDSSGKIVHWGPSVNLVMKVQYYNSPTSFNSSPGGGPTLSGGNSTTIYLKLKDDGTNLTFSFCYDGVAWFQWMQLSRTAFLASGPTRVGLGVDSENSSSVSLACDWFRRTV